MIRKTHKYLTTLAVALLSFAYAASIVAAENQPLLDKSKFSIGAGISNNSVSGPVDDEIGFQFFAAYDLTAVKLMEGVDSSIEFGIMDYGFNGDSTGIWGTYVIDGAIKGRLGWLGRIGIDIGDDSGFMLGAGIGYAISKQMDVRGEYVIRDDTDSLQLNLIYHL